MTWTAPHAPLDKALFAFGLPGLVAYTVVKTLARRAQIPAATDLPDTDPAPIPTSGALHESAEANARTVLTEGRVDITSGQTGVTYDTLLIPWLCGARRIVITDPYIRVPHQFRNLRELVAAIAATRPEGRITIEVVTGRFGTDVEHQRQRDSLLSVQKYADQAEIDLIVSYQDPREMHPRDIVTDTGWRIALDRGLDIWNRAQGPAAHRQDLRTTKHCYVIYERTCA